MGEKKQFIKAYRYNILLAAYSVPALSECLSFKCLEEKPTCYVGADIKPPWLGWRRLAGKLFASVGFSRPGEGALLGAKGVPSFPGSDLVGLQLGISMLKCPVSVVSIGFGAQKALPLHLAKLEHLQGKHLKGLLCQTVLQFPFWENWSLGSIGA